MCEWEKQKKSQNSGANKNDFRTFYKEVYRNHESGIVGHFKRFKDFMGYTGREQCKSGSWIRNFGMPSPRANQLASKHGCCRSFSQGMQTNSFFTKR